MRLPYTVQRYIATPLITISALVAACSPSITSVPIETVTAPNPSPIPPASTQSTNKVYSGTITSVKPLKGYRDGHQITLAYAFFLETLLGERYAITVTDESCIERVLEAILDTEDNRLEASIKGFPLHFNFIAPEGVYTGTVGVGCFKTDEDPLLPLNDLGEMVRSNF